MTTMKNARLRNRILAIIYDSLIAFFITVIIIMVLQFAISQGEEIPADSYIMLVLKNFWVLISFFYFGYYWTKRGQTPGMKVWKIKAITNEGGLMTWGGALKRYVFSLLGIGLLWIIIDKDRLALQDKLSGTRLINVVSIT